MIYAILSAVLMGSTAIFNKFALKEFNPMFATIINALIASIFSLFFVKKFRKLRMNFYVVFVGLFNAAGLLFMFIGLSKLDPGIAMVLGTSYYIFTSMYSVLLFKEKLSVNVLLQKIKNILEKTPPELAADIMQNGLIVVGGVARLRGLDKLISEQTGVRTYIPEDPHLTCAKGTGILLEDIELLNKVQVN